MVGASTKAGKAGSVHAIRVSLGRDSPVVTWDFKFQLCKVSEMDHLGLSRIGLHLLGDEVGWSGGSYYCRCFAVAVVATKQLKDNELEFYDKIFGSVIIIIDSDDAYDALMMQNIII